MFRNSCPNIFTILGYGPYFISDIVKKEKKRAKTSKKNRIINSNINVDVPNNQNNNIEMQKGDNLGGKYF